MSDFAVTVASLAVAFDFSDNSSNVIYRPSEPQAANINCLISNDKIFMRNINYKDFKVPALMCPTLRTAKRHPESISFIYFFILILLASPEETKHTT